ncbi:helix-turn-helix domain-containing protein [Paracoccus sp. SSJ]|uniref:helix-turn-helix domain-containing protein n=1 Tax=Paracoccus sp. SSJ TaxID=3050636 RepID=UPI00254AE870|nr:helix-turn-helix domain-containing protein [Paracoccus sp. SSJ]MDK8874387.1 helix-turn-helix domain-containing protein [Paracoccus sp. SSJ]
MSNKVSVLVYSRKIGSPVRKAVLVYFAERASDNGEGVWAAKSTIADAIECGRSTVIRTINDFVSEGILSVVGTRKHKNGETVEYAMNLRAIAALPSVKSDANTTEEQPVPERDPSRSGTPPVPERDPYPSRSGTQTTNRTTIEPSEYIPARDPASILCDVASPRAVKSFLGYRRKIRKPVSEIAAERLAKILNQIASQGGSPDDALGLAEEKGWQSIKAEWYFKEICNEQSSIFSTANRPMARGSQHGGGKPLGGLVGAFVRSEAARGH